MQSYVEIRTKDSKKIWLSSHTPEHSIGKVMILAPAGGITQDFYRSFADYFCQWGFTVVSFDYRGIGSSGPQQLKGYEANMHQWAVQDIDAVILHVKNKYINHEIIYVGHCIGGEIVGLACASQYISKLVLVNSALSCKKLWPLKDKFRAITMKTVVRILNKWFGYFPGKKMGLIGDMPKGVMHEWANWCNHPNGLFDLFPDNNYRKLQVPLLAFSFSDDWHCPPKAVQELLNRFANAIITWHHIRPFDFGLKKVGKLGFFDPKMKTTFWLMILGWLNESDLVRSSRRSVER